MKSRTATTHIKRQLISGDNSYQATTHINQNSYQNIKIIETFDLNILNNQRKLVN